MFFISLASKMTGLYMIKLQLRSVKKVICSTCFLFYELHFPLSEVFPLLSIGRLGSFVATLMSVAAVSHLTVCRPCLMSLVSPPASVVSPDAIWLVSHSLDLSVLLMRQCKEYNEAPHAPWKEGTVVLGALRLIWCQFVEVSGVYS